VIAAIAAVWVTARAPAAGIRLQPDTELVAKAAAPSLSPSAPRVAAAATAAPARAPASSVAAPGLPATEADPSEDSAREVSAVVETSATRGLAANTPMKEEDAARHLARAWHSIFRSAPREATLSVLWAHWAHETARGQRMHAYNFAGLKGHGPSGVSVVVWTREGDAPNDLVKRSFRAYRGPAEGARDYLRLLVTRYPSAVRAARDGNAYAFAVALELGGYFTGNSRVYTRALTSLAFECRRRGLGADLEAPDAPSG